MTADTEKVPSSKNTTCLICDASVGVSTRNSCFIFQQNVSTSDKPLYKIIGLVLNLEVQEDSVHSAVICKKCFKLLNEADELQERLTEIQIDIKANYHRTIRKYDGSLPPEEATGDPTTLLISADNKSKIKHGPGRPKKISNSPPEIKPQQATFSEVGAGNKISGDDEIAILFNDQKENKSGNEMQQIVPERVELEEDDDDGDLGDPNDEDYIPDLTELANLQAESGDVQIKVEVMEEDITDKVLGKKLLGRKKKLSPIKPELPALIPAMVVSRDAAVYTCLVCSASDKFIADAKGITHHLKESHNLRLYICDMCGQEFFKRNELSAHLDEHVTNEERDFQCEVCNRIFSNLRLYRVHKRMHYPQVKNWTCDQCGKRYLSRNMLEEHMNTHTGNRPYVCHCGKDFTSKYTFKAHEKTHLERPRPFNCDKCNKTFLTQANLQQHEKTHSAARNFVCQICNKTFSTARNLEVHAIIHTGFKSFICRMCGKAFARKAEIRDHERTHTGEKPYQCEFCGATFSQRSNLQSHKRATHYDDKRYKCMECGKGFKRRRLLDYHMKAAHTGERPYKCSVCAATFIYPEHFKKHRRIHTGEKPFLCEVCGKAFNSRDNRNAHRFVHSDKKPYECLVCGMGFMRKPLLYNHMQTQGHLNDTIVVNQPRLTTDEDNILAAQTAAEGMEMTFVTDSDGNTKLVRADSVEIDPQNQDTKMYITELKEHVIFDKEREDGRIVEDEIVETAEYDDTVQHLIIDGQVHFANPGGMEALEEANGEIESVAEITTLEDGTRHALVVPSTRHTYTEQTTAMTTEAGTVQLVQIRIQGEGEGQPAWINILQPSDQ